jgi:hypothetical protein
MTERFLRLFPAYRKLERKATSNAALIASLERYIGALEGKAKMQDELTLELRKQLNASRSQQEIPH